MIHTIDDISLTPELAQFVAEAAAARDQPASAAGRHPMVLQLALPVARPWFRA